MSWMGLASRSTISVHLMNEGRAFDFGRGKSPGWHGTRAHLIINVSEREAIMRDHGARGGHNGIEEDNRPIVFLQISRLIC